MSIIEEKVFNNDVGIHFISSYPEKNTSTSLIIIPGLTEAAEDYLEIMKQIDRRCTTISLRGRGKSDAPLTGYTLEDHIQDIEAVIEKLGINDLILFGFSRGVSYMLGYALKFPKRVKGIIIGDYPAVHTELPDKWVDWFVELPPWRGKTPLERMNEHALIGIQKESYKKEFWNELNALDCPVLVIGGGQKGAILSSEMSQIYKEALSDIKVVTFEESDHNIFEPNTDRFVKLVNSFLKDIS